MRMRRYDRVLKQWLRKLTDKRMLPLWLCIAGIVIVFVLVTSMGRSSSSSITPSDTALYGRSEITVGVVTDSLLLSEKSDYGTIRGFNCDFISEALSAIYPDTRVKFTEITSQIASYKLKNLQIDLAIGAFTKGVTKTQGLSVSSPYYTDRVYAYVAPSIDVDTLSGLQGRKVYATTTEFTRSSLSTALKAINLNLDTHMASSYSDALFAIENGNADAIISMRCMSEEAEQKLKRIEEPVMSVGYCVLAWTSNSRVTTLINAQISRMTEDGTLSELEETWGIADPAYAPDAEKE